jgi:hypothetical protein
MTDLPAFHRGSGDVIFRHNDQVHAIPPRELGRLAARIEFGANRGPIRIDGQHIPDRLLIDVRAAFEEGLADIPDCAICRDAPGTEAHGWCVSCCSGAIAHDDHMETP